jgi:hypothetical protein
MNAVMEYLQDNIYGRLLADAPLVNVVILEERKGIAANDIAQVLGSQTLRGGKKGVAVIVNMPFFFVSEPDAVGPRLQMELVVRCLEKPLVNRGPGGSGITGEELAIRVLQVLHHFIVADIPVTLTARSIEATVYDSGEREYALHFKSMLQLSAVPKTAAPVILGDSVSGVTITGPAGATVCFTLDGSYPSPTNTAGQQVLLDSQGNAILDSLGNNILTGDGEAIAVASGTLVRAVAYPTDPNSQASNVAAKTVS